MATSAQWLVEGLVIEAKIEHQIGVSESGRFNRQLLDYFKQAARDRIHVLIDVSEMDMSQINVTLLSTILLPLSMEAVCGWVVLYGTEKRVNEVFGITITYAFRKRFRTCLDRNSAFVFLESNVHDLALPA